MRERFGNQLLLNFEDMGGRGIIKGVLLMAVAALFCRAAGAQSLAKSYPFTQVPAKTVLPPKTLSIPANLPTQHFGFFCRQELKWQQKGVPILFRLGSAEQCNRLEGKPGYR